MIDINGTTRVCGLIGNPVGHSISPVIHNSLAQLMDMNIVYTTFKVEKGDVVTAVNGAYALNILGLNVTVPHKQAVMESLVDIDPLAKAIGAVNTLVRTAKGYKGYNTDILGLERELIDEGVVLLGSEVVEERSAAPGAFDEIQFFVGLYFRQLLGDPDLHSEALRGMPLTEFYVYEFAARGIVPAVFPTVSVLFRRIDVVIDHRIAEALLVLSVGFLGNVVFQTFGPSKTRRVRLSRDHDHFCRTNFFHRTRFFFGDAVAAHIFSSAAPARKYRRHKT